MNGELRFGVVNPFVDEWAAREIIRNVNRSRCYVIRLTRRQVLGDLVPHICHLAVFRGIREDVDGKPECLAIEDFRWRCSQC